MLESVKIKKVFQKDVNKICISIGAFYAIIGLFSIGMIKLQELMTTAFETPPDESFSLYQDALHDIWYTYMPLMFVLGLFYLGFGLFYKKIITNKYVINLVLSIMSIVWVIGYTISTLNNADILFADLGEDKYLAYGFAGFGFIIVLAIFTIPQYIIGKRIKNLEIDKKNITQK